MISVLDNSLTVNIIAFLVAASLVWFAGTRMVAYGEEIATRFELTHEFVGLFFLATATELPEIVTTITSAGQGNAPLVLGNLFGGLTMQTAILAFVDLFFVHRALTSWPRKPTHALEAVFLIILLSILLLVINVGEIRVLPALGLGAIVLFCAYPICIGILKKFDERSSWKPIDLPDEAEQIGAFISSDTLSTWTTQKIIWHALGVVLLILVAGYITADSAGEIAQQTGLSASFVGVALLAVATSAPELSTTIAAARIGSYTMAISNIFGSNLIMLALILPADLAYREGPLLAEVDQVSQFSILTGITVTAIYVAGLLLRRTPKLFGAGIDSILVLTIYFGSLIILYRM